MNGGLKIQFSFRQTALVTAAVVVVDYVLKINGDLSNFCQGFKRGILFSWQKNT